MGSIEGPELVDPSTDPTHATSARLGSDRYAVDQDAAVLRGMRISREVSDFTAVSR